MALTTPTELATWMDPDMRDFFDRLPDRQKRSYVAPIEQAASREAREWRVARAVQMLRERRRR